jgi:hypothetical protein
VSIDNPLEKTRELIPDDSADIFGGVMQIASTFLPLAGIVSAVQGALSKTERRLRITAALHALCDELQRTQDRWPSDMQSIFASVWFKRMLHTLIEETGRAVNENHARLLARVAATGCFPEGENAHRQEDLASYIHDLARLGQDDIQMLKLLRNANREAIKTAPNLNKPDYFIEHLPEFKRMAANLKIHPDDCVALAARLGGFGLACEVPRVPTRQSPEDYCFRPTAGEYIYSRC